MGNFDVTTPAGSDLLSQGDDRIREFKLAMREALRAGDVAGDDIEGVEAIFPGSSPSTAPVYRYRGLKGTTAQRPTAGQYGLYFDTDRKVLQRDNGTSWEDVGQMVVDGSITEAKLSTSVAGGGLLGGANTPLSVNVGAGLEIANDAVKLAAGIDGAGITLTGSVMSVNVDNSTVEISSDNLRIKAAGVTGPLIANSTMGFEKFEIKTYNDSNVTLPSATAVVTRNYPNKFIVGVKATDPEDKHWNITANVYGASVSNAGGTFNTGAPYSSVSFDRVEGYGSDITLTSIVIYYIDWPTPTF